MHLTLRAIAEGLRSLVAREMINTIMLSIDIMYDQSIMRSTYTQYIYFDIQDIIVETHFWARIEVIEARQRFWSTKQVGQAPLPSTTLLYPVLLSVPATVVVVSFRVCFSGRERASVKIMAMRAPMDPDTVRERLDELGEELQTVASLVHLSIKNQQHERVDDAEGAFDCSGDAERKFQASRCSLGGWVVLALLFVDELNEDGW